VSVADPSLPVADPDRLIPTQDWSEPYWNAAARHQLVIQKCADCGQVLGQPQPMCSRCHGYHFEWPVVSGRGTLYTWTTLHRQRHPSFPVPFTLAVVALEDYPEVHIVGRVVLPTAAAEGALAIGSLVRVVWVAHELATLPGFELIPA
jgi:uncharacterized OB-fold protein